MDEKKLVISRTILGELIVGILNADGNIENPINLVIETDEQGNVGQGKIRPYPYLFPMDCKVIVFKDKLMGISEDVPEQLKEMYNSLTSTIKIAKPTQLIVPR